ncbi:MAG: hypothetical protein WD604_08125 [Balneolaceae bacterium]
MKKIDTIDPILQSHFLNLFQIALADTDIHPDELKFLYDFGIKRGIEQKQIDDLINNPHKIRFKIPDSIYKRIELLYDFATLILADGKIDPREIKIFKSLALDFGFEKENIPDIIDFLIEEGKKGTEKEKIHAIVRKNLKPDGEEND